MNEIELVIETIPKDVVVTFENEILVATANVTEALLLLTKLFPKWKQHKYLWWILLVTPHLFLRKFLLLTQLPQ